MTYSDHWTPVFRVAFYVIFTVRVIGAAFPPIADCDETFNYWEPTHYLVYGEGFQTWEYSPEFALRPYLYILFHASFVWVAKMVAVNKIAVFYLLRYFLGMQFLANNHNSNSLTALVSAYCEATFYESVTRRFKGSSGVHYLLLSALSIGPFFAGISYLPSSFAMYCFLLSFAAWFEGGAKDKAAVLWGIAGVVLSGWPFCAVAAVPLAIHIFYRQGLFNSILWGIQGAVFTLVPQILADSYYYGKLTCSVCNLVLYNTKGFFGANLPSEIENKGPLLYGTEPWYFYFLNMMLNFGPITLLLSLSSGLVLLVVYLIIMRTNVLKHWEDVKPGANINGIPLESDRDRLNRERKKWKDMLINDAIYLSPMYIWLAFMIPQAHKEERFLFVIYPSILLSASIALSRVQELLEIPKVREIKGKKVSTRPKYSRQIVKVIRFGVPLFLLLFSVYRLSVLSFNSSGPTKAFTWLHHTELDGNTIPVSICVGREWHRFPSSFFLPREGVKLRFIRSAFEGELPQPYVKGENGTSEIQSGFNDENKLEENRYIKETECSYLVDMELREQKEPRYSRDTKQWDIAFSEKVLDLAASKKYWRTFCLPIGLFGDKCVYGNFHVLKRKMKR